MGPSEVLEGFGPTLRSIYGALDRVVSKRVFALLEQWGMKPVLSPATAALPLVASPTPVILCCVVYLVVVGVGVLAIRWSRSAPPAKDPFFLRVLVILHNCFLFALSAFMCGGLVIEALRNR